MLSNLLIIFFIFYGLNIIIEKDDNRYLPIELILTKYGIKINLPQMYFNYGNYSLPDEDFEELLVKAIPNTSDSFNKFCGEKRTDFGTNYTANPIVTLGCSYMYGHGLKKEESFSYLISKLTQRPVFGFASCGSSGLKNISDFEQRRFELLNADYYVYVYMWEHFTRFLFVSHVFDNYVELFEVKGLKQKLAQISIFRYIFINWEKYLILSGSDNTEKRRLYFKQVIKFINKKIKEYSPNAKLIVLIYSEKLAKGNGSPDAIFLNDSVWKEIEKETDIIVVNSNDLLGFKFDKNYKLKEDISDWHPNAKAWEVLAPVFVNKY